MADIIDQIVAESAVKQVAELKVQMNELLEVFIKINAQTGKKQPNPIASSEGNAQLDEMAKLLKQISSLESQLAVANTEQFKSVQRLRAERTEAVKLAKQESQLAGTERNTLARAEALIRKYTQEKKNLNLATKEGIALNASYNKAIENANNFTKKYGDTISNQRKNIGNYKSANIELIQVLREMPAFANSAQTGFMALSNNLPQLAERIKIMRSENVGWGATLKQLGGQLIGFNAIIAIATTLLTVYGKDIVAFVQGMFSANSVTEVGKRLQKDFAKATLEATKNVAEESGRLKVLRAAIEDTELPMSKRLKAIAKLKEEFPKYFKDLKDEDLLNRRVATAYELAAEGILKKARAQAASAKITQLESQKLEIEAERERDRIQSDKDIAAASGGTTRTRRGIGGDLVPYKVSEAKLKAEITHEIIKNERVYANKIGLIQKEQDFYIKKVTENSDFELDKAEKVAKAKKDKVDKDKGDKKEPLIFKDIFGKDDIDAQGKEIEARVALAVKQYYDALDKMLGDPDKPNQFRKALEELQKGGVEGEESAELLLSIKIEEASKKKTKEDLDKYLKELETIGKISQEFLSNASDIGGIIFDKQLLRLDEEKRAIEDKYALEAELIKANFTTIEERDKALAILAIKKAAEDEAIRKKELQAKQKQARFQRNLDIAQITIATSLAVMKIWNDDKVPTAAKPGYIALAISTGAAQLAKAIATPIPQYAEGTQDHKGGMAVVGDGGRKEVVQTPDGKTYLTPDKSTIVDLPQHTKVFKDVNTYLYQNPKSRKYNSTSTGAIVDFEETNKKLDSLINITKRKSMSVNLYGDAGFYTYQKNNVK